MADVIPLGPKKGSGFTTPPEVANRLREELEEIISKGILGGMVSGEQTEGRILYAFVPQLSGFAEGHLKQVKRAYDETGEG